MDTNKLAFTVQISEEALQELKIIKKSRTPAVRKKIERIVQELQETPEKGVGAPEQLKGKEGIVYSRALNKKDRLIYEIFKEENLVVIVQFLGHYQDK